MSTRRDVITYSAMVRHDVSIGRRGSAYMYSTRYSAMPLGCYHKWFTASILRQDKHKPKASGQTQTESVIVIPAWVSWFAAYLTFYWLSVIGFQTRVPCEVLQAPYRRSSKLAVYNFTLFSVCIIIMVYSSCQ